MIYPSPTLYPGASNAYPSWVSPTGDHIFTYGGTAVYGYDHDTNWTYTPVTG